MSSWTLLTTIDALRVTGSALETTRKATVPSPWPVLPPVISSHAAPLVADQAHSRSTLTFTWPVPPAGPNAAVGLVSDAWQRAAVGPVTLVFAELPQAIHAMVAP